jgi:phage shock protein PspC (stress-responsive transcriptional regulator)
MAPAGKPSEDTMEDRNEHIHDENEPERGDEPTAERPGDEPVEETPAADEQPEGPDEPMVEGPEEEPVADAAEEPEPVAEAPGKDEPVAEDTDEPEEAERPGTDEPTEESPTVEDQPAAEESTAEQPEAARGPEDPRGPQAPAGDEAPTEPIAAGAGAGAGAGGGAAGGGPGAVPPPRRLLRAREGRVLGGVCAGLGRYFNTDPVFFRIGAIVLTLIGGAGVLLYLAALLLIPKEDSVAQTAVDGASVDGRSRALVIAGVVVLLVIAWPFLLGGGLFIWGVLIPLAVLVAAGVLVWWLVSGEGPSGDAGDIARRAALGLGLLVLCAIVAVGGAWAAAAGGEAIVAALVIAAGVAIVAGAFVKPVRWLILPALALACSAGTVSAAGIDLDGGVGDRYYHPDSTVDLRDRYELGIGELVVDMSDTDLPGGDTPLELDLGVGSARLIVPDDVCVATTADVGMGYAGVFNADNEGIDVDYDEQRTAPPDVSRLVVDAEIGVGELLIGHATSDFGEFEARFRGDRDHLDNDIDRGLNTGCETR